jgi:hypothetical protein
MIVRLVQERNPWKERTIILFEENERNNQDFLVQRNCKMKQQKTSLKFIMNVRE